MHVTNNPAEAERFEGTLRRYLTRKIGFEAVMRIRCTRGTKYSWSPKDGMYYIVLYAIT